MGEIATLLTPSPLNTTRVTDGQAAPAKDRPTRRLRGPVINPTRAAFPTAADPRPGSGRSLPYPPGRGAFHGSNLAWEILHVPQRPPNPLLALAPGGATSVVQDPGFQGARADPTSRLRSPISMLHPELVSRADSRSWPWGRRRALKRKMRAHVPANGHTSPSTGARRRARTGVL